MSEKKSLPKIEGEHGTFTDKAQMVLFLAQDPPTQWVKKHPVIAGWEYISIDRIEFMLTWIFGDWYVEVKEVKEVFNAIVVTVRLHYLDYISNVWKYQDGIGAKGLQQDKGAKPGEMLIKQAACEMAAPIAETNAFKDAAEKIGRIFGRDLNRKNVIDYDTVLSKDDRFKNAKIVKQ